MILGFSTIINEKETFFVEKIHSGLLQNYLMDGFNIGYDHNFDLDVLSSCGPKFHTIREDKNNRWKAGNKIDFFINVRKKNMFRFAPVLPVVSIQKIEIIYHTNAFDLANEIPFKRAVIVDDKKRLNDNEIKQLAENDGFISTDEFFAYFDESFSGKLIHWTDLKY